MLAASTYTTHFVDARRAEIAGQLAAYRALLAASGAKIASGKEVLAFARPFFNNLVLAMDRAFVHRTRALELKDGNPLNEVRMLCDGILEGGGILAANKTIKYDPSRSVLKLKIGDPIAMTAEDFERLAKAYFADIEAKFT